MDDLEARLAGPEPIVSEDVAAPVAIVTFGGLAMKAGMAPGEFLRVTEGLPVSRIFVRDPQKCSYQQGLPGAPTWERIADQILPHIRHHERTVFLGNSAGASAALIAATLLQPDAVLAFSPVTFLDRPRRLVHRDTRWRHQVRAARRGPKAQRRYADVASYLAGAPAIEADVYFAERMRLDSVHARRLPGVHLHPIPSDDHNVIKELRASGRLRQVIEAALTT